jgi:hypothetical protein
MRDEARLTGDGGQSRPRRSPKILEAGRGESSTPTGNCRQASGARCTMQAVMAAAHQHWTATSRLTDGRFSEIGPPNRRLGTQQWAEAATRPGAVRLPPQRCPLTPR